MLSIYLRSFRGIIMVLRNITLQSA